MLAWVGQITSGHTKSKCTGSLTIGYESYSDIFTGVTTNAVVLIGYAAANAAGPSMWKSEYQPLYDPHCFI